MTTTYYFEIDVDNIGLDGPVWTVLSCQRGPGLLVHCPGNPDKSKYTKAITEYNGMTLAELRNSFAGQQYYSWVFDENICAPSRVWQVITTYETTAQLDKWSSFKALKQYGRTGMSVDRSTVLLSAFNGVEQCMDQLTTQQYIDLMNVMKQYHDNTESNQSTDEHNALIKLEECQRRWNAYMTRDDCYGSQEVDLAWVDQANEEQLSSWNEGRE